MKPLLHLLPLLVLWCPLAAGDGSPGEYRLSVGDTVVIAVYLEPDLTTTARLDPAGCVRLPLVDQLKLAGLTTAEAQQEVERALREGEFLLKPHVTVRLESRVAREVMISGQVRSPGSYPLPAEGGMSVIDLVVKAGGFTDLARANSVTLTRPDGEGVMQSRVIEAARLIRGEGNLKDPTLQLQAGDVVFVPERIF